MSTMEKQTERDVMYKPRVKQRGTCRQDSAPCIAYKPVASCAWSRQHMELKY